MRKVSVIGVGKLGLCFSLSLEASGYDVLGVDVSPDYIASLNDRSLRSDETGVEEALQRATHFFATDDLESAVEHSDMLFVVVATPSLKSGRYDHTQIENIVNKLLQYGSRGPKDLVICCTTMPGYCDTVQARLGEVGYAVSYNPEFIAQGTILRDQKHPDMILIGEDTEAAGLRIQQICESMVVNEAPVYRMSRTEAEITKLSLNCFLTTKIAYANMIGDIVIQAGGDATKVLSAIGADTRVGAKYLRYGFGYGGPCFPRDNRALSVCATDLGVSALISKASDKSNAEHLKFQVEQFEKSQKKDELVIFDMITYKPESTMIVESQQLAYAVEVARRGFRVKLVERAPVIERVRAVYGELFEYEVRV